MPAPLRAAPRGNATAAAAALDAAWDTSAEAQPCCAAAGFSEWEVAVARADSCPLAASEGAGCFPGVHGLWELAYRGGAAAWTGSSLYGGPLDGATAFCLRLRCRLPRGQIGVEVKSAWSEPVVLTSSKSG